MPMNIFQIQDRNASNNEENIRDLLQFSEVFTSKIKAEIDSFSKKITEISSDISEQQFMFQSGFSDLSLLNQAKQSASDALILTRQLVNSLSLETSEIPNAIAQSENSEELYRLQNELFSVDGVRSMLKSEAIFVRVPMLWSRQINRYSSKSKVEKMEISSHLYMDAIQKSIQTNVNFQEYDFRKFQYKVFYFLFCFNKNTDGKVKIADNDNRDIKACQDAVASFLPGGDSALTSSTFLESVYNNELPTGTFITVSEKASPLITPEIILKYWKESGDFFTNFK